MSLQLVCVLYSHFWHYNPVSESQEQCLWTVEDSKEPDIHDKGLSTHTHTERERERERERDLYSIAVVVAVVTVQFKRFGVRLFTFFLSMKKSHVYHSCSYLIKSTVKTKM